MSKTVPPAATPTRRRKPASDAAVTQPSNLRVVGKVVMLPLDAVTKNTWNPNRMTPHLRESLKSGLLKDGWLISQSLLIWGTDNKGKIRNVIIDGEHRWTVAGELGFQHGPMVKLDGLTEAQAKALTIKMNQKRGNFDEASLGLLVRSIQEELEVDVSELGLDLGFETDAMLTLMAFEAEDINQDIEPKDNTGARALAENDRSMSAHVKLVQLYFKVDQHTKFTEAIRKLAKQLKKDNVTDTVFEVVTAAAAKLK